MQLPYNYSPTMHGGDPYRQTVSSGPGHAIRLPPLTLETHSQGLQPYVPSSQQMSSPPMSTYYAPQHNVIYHHPQQIAHLQSMPSYRTYGIPIGHTRPHKKEIKRRTKTGCMTCRKRRIKCDEQKPVCRNCVKSKRECLGYSDQSKDRHGPGAPGALSQQRSNITCCTPQQSTHQSLQQHPSSPASTPAASTAIASSPTTTASTGVTTPTSSMSYYPPVSANSSFASTVSFSQPAYSTASSVATSYVNSPVHQAYTPVSQSYPTSAMSNYYPASATQQAYTLPSPLPSSKPAHMSGYFPSSSPEPLHAVSADRHLPAMNRPVAIY